jgi:hypothetical protein
MSVRRLSAVEKATGGSLRRDTGSTRKINRG